MALRVFYLATFDINHQKSGGSIQNQVKPFQYLHTRVNSKLHQKHVGNATI